MLGVGFFLACVMFASSLFHVAPKRRYHGVRKVRRFQPKKNQKKKPKKGEKKNKPKKNIYIYIYIYITLFEKERYRPRRRKNRSGSQQLSNRKSISTEARGRGAAGADTHSNTAGHHWDSCLTVQNTVRVYGAGRTRRNYYCSREGVGNRVLS